MWVCVAAERVRLSRVEQKTREGSGIGLRVEEVALGGAADRAAGGRSGGDGQIVQVGHPLEPASDVGRWWRPSRSSCQAVDHHRGDTLIRPPTSNPVNL